MKKNQQNEAIIKPVPLTDFSREKIIYIPVDSPSLILQKAIKKHRLKEKKILFGHLYRLENKTILYECIGAPLAVLSLERLIASRAKEIIMLGFCGSLNPEIQIMEVVSIQKAISEEGTSKHYFSRKDIFYPSPTLKKRIENTLSSMKLPFLNGTIVSTDAPYRETKSWLAEKQKKGIDFVDMETSAVLALAHFHDIKAAALMIVSDELSHDGWEIGFSNSKLDERINRYFLPFLTD